MDTELDDFMKNQEHKSASTKKQYKNQYHKLHTMLSKNVADSSEKYILDAISDIKNPNSYASILNIGIMIRKNKGLKTSLLEKTRESNRNTIIENVKQKNVLLDASLPSYEELNDYLDFLHKTHNHQDFVINYLLINLHTRNEDLAFKIIKKLSDASDDDTNYMVVTHAGKITFIRNNYKTSKKEGSLYGQKINKIDDPKFKSSIRQLYRNNPDDFFIKPDNVGYYVKKATFKGIGEANYNKIIVNHFRDDFEKLDEISQSRGTSLKTLKQFYDIKNKPSN